MQIDMGINLKPIHDKTVKTRRELRQHDRDDLFQEQIREAMITSASEAAREEGYGH